MKKTIFQNLTLALLIAVVSSAAISLGSEGVAPIADASSSRYVAENPVVLDGIGSYNQDDSDTLSYTWRQISGSTVVISNADTATPTISGFVQTDEIQECEFELIVSDGQLTSLPDTVKVIIVPDFGADTLRLENPPFDCNKPTLIYFGGGNCIVGNEADLYRPSWAKLAWYEKANVISFSPYGPDPSIAGLRTYYRYGDMIIVYLSAAAPNYNQPIQTSGHSTGGQPAIDVGIRLNQTYADARYAVNRITFFEATGFCRDYKESIEQFLANFVDGEQCWIDSYSSTLPGTYGLKKDYGFQSNVLNVWFDAATGSYSDLYKHTLPGDFYRNSLIVPDMQEFNHGIIAGAYWSVIGPGKNLQLASTPGVQTYKFQWYGSSSSGYMDFYNEPNHPGRLPEPVTLIDPVDDSGIVGADGAVFSCEESENAVGYQLLFGPDPYRVMDYYIVSDTTSPPTDIITSFPYEQTWWTIRVYDAFGSTIYADPVCFFPENVEPPEPNLVAYWELDEEQGDIAYDSVGNIDAAVYNGQWTDGRINGALLFNGLNTYIDCGDSLLVSTQKMTLSMWLEPQHMGGMRYVFTRAKEQSNDIDYALMRHLEGNVEFALAQEGSDPVCVLSNETTPLNEWTHVAVCLDGSEVQLYINGQLDASAGYAQRIPREGCRLWISSLGANTRFYYGRIDDVRIYNIALSAEEIAALAQ